MREKLIHELEEERRLRLESEKRLREVTEESELGQAQMVSLQQNISRMEETVRSLLQNQGVLEQTAVDTVEIMKVYKDKLSEEVQKQRDGPEESGSLPPANQQQPEPDPGPLIPPPPSAADPTAAAAGRAEEDRDETTLLLERLRALEGENSALALENESQREQYERCLDEVANQVVQALLTQKDLREECLKLRTRVFDLEQQNRTLSVLFQQRVKPASDLLLQKLHSRIMDLSAADLLLLEPKDKSRGFLLPRGTVDPQLEPDKSRGFLLPRNTDSPPLHEAMLSVRAGLPVARCLSQLSLTVTVPPPLYPRSSCSSSELSLSSACSEYSSGSYTWNDGRSCGKMSSLTWEKRLSLGSSAPGNICAPLEEQPPTRRKESHILEGLRKLQRRKHRSSSTCSSKVSKSGYKDCMNSNEGIYSLGIKNSSKGVSKPPYVGRATAFGVGVRKVSYDSDDADDESAHSSRRDNVPSRDNWLYCKRLSHSISDSLCSWEGLQDNGVGGDSSAGSTAARHPPGYDSKDRPEKLLSFISSFLSGGGRPSAFSKPSKQQHFRPTVPDCPLHLSDTDDMEELNSESSDVRTSVNQQAEQLEKDSERLSRDVAKLIAPHCLRRDQGRTQSADGRPRPFSLIKEPKGGKCSQSEESLLAIFDAEGEPIELCAQQKAAGLRNDLPGSKTDYTEVSPQERPIRQIGNVRNYTVLQSPEKPSEYQSKANKMSSSKEGSAERLSVHVTPQRKLIKPPTSRANKGHSIPPTNEASGPKTNGSRIPGRGKPSGSPLRVSKGSSTDPSPGGNSGPSAQEKSPSSPPVKMSRFIKAPGGSCAQSPKTVNSKLPSRGDCSKGSSGSPHLSRRHLDHVDYGEQPTRDKHCETSKNELRSPSPPLPPGRTTSLLIRPNYEGSPQAHKTGAAQPSTPTTVRGPPPSYHPPPVPNMQSTLPVKGQDSVDLDAGYGTALAPQKLVDKTSQHLQKSPAVTQTPSKGTSKRATAKHYLPPASSGCAPEHFDNAPKSSKNVPPPYSALRGSSLQSTFASKRRSTHEIVNQSMHKNSASLPVSLQGQPQCTIESQDSKIVSPPAVASPPTSIVSAPNQVEKASKTRIPMGFKAFLKSPPAHKNSPSMPGKQEKDHINSVSKETVISNASTQCDSLQPLYSIDSPPKTSITEGKGEAQARLLEGEAHVAVLSEEGEVCDKGKRGSQLFSRSISVTTKPHLKPALGMNGAKARSQSFSTNYMEKPNINVPDGPVKIRTQIITNSGERGNSLTRQSSLDVTSGGSGESPVRCITHRLSHYGGMTVSNSHNVLPERTSIAGLKSEGTMKGEGVAPQPQKEVRSLPITDRIGLKNSRKPVKVASHPQFQSPSSRLSSSEPSTQEVGGKVTSPTKPDPTRVITTQTGPSNEAPVTEEKKVSPAACTIEEKVMMGIEENLQKCQGQEKVSTSEAKQKTAPSLANWFGLRKSKLPALNGKKADSPKGKEEKKELKIGSVLSGKQTKSDKKKDKKKNDNQCKDGQEEQNLSETNNKLSSIMDHCNIQMGQIANQIQCTTAYIGKDQFMKELLGRSPARTDTLDTPHPGISLPKKHSELRGDMEICTDTATIIMTQKINSRGENEEGHGPDGTCQDHMIDMMRTKRLSQCERRSNSHALPESQEKDTQRWSNSHALPESQEKDTRRWSNSHALPESQEKDTQRQRKEPQSPGDRALRVCAYSGSSSSSDTETETELESPGSAPSSPRKHGTDGPKQSSPAEQNEDTLKRSSVPGTGLSIMDYYQQDVFSQLDKESRRRSQYGLLHKDSALDGKAGDRLSKGIQLDQMSVNGVPPPGSLDASLEAFNRLNHGDGGPYAETGLAGDRRGDTGKSGGEDRRGPDEPLSSSSFSSGNNDDGGSKAGTDAVGSLSDSLYDSFSSCTSQGSNDV